MKDVLEGELAFRDVLWWFWWVECVVVVDRREFGELDVCFLGFVGCVLVHDILVGFLVRERVDVFGGAVCGDWREGSHVDAS